MCVCVCVLCHIALELRYTQKKKDLERNEDWLRQLFAEVEDWAGKHSLCFCFLLQISNKYNKSIIEETAEEEGGKKTSENKHERIVWLSVHLRASSPQLEC